MINKTFLMGHLGRDPELRRFPDGGAVANLSVATSEWVPARDGKAGRAIVDWHRVVCRGKLAELVVEKLHKGSLIFLEGRTHTRAYKKDGTNVKVTEIVCERVKFLDLLLNRGAEDRVGPGLAPDEPVNAGDGDGDVPF